MRSLNLVALASLLLVGCGEDDKPTEQIEPESCTSCQGCCDPENGCLPGDTAAACGIGGVACTRCGDQESCEQGQCVASSSDCPGGCIVPGTNACITPGTSDEACGPLGGVCASCTAIGQVCEAATRSCVERPGECDPAELFSCMSQQSYCDSEQACRKCPEGTYNCDGANDNGCESEKVCGEPQNECLNEVETWPHAYQTASYSGTLTQAEARLSDTQPFVLLRVEDFHLDTQYPKTVTFSSATRWGQPNGCDVCVLVAEGCTGYEGSAENYYTCMGKMYFVQEGTATVEQADLQPSPGTFKVSLSNLKLVEWNESLDQPVANGNCWKVDQADFDVSW